jgi:hypothetical protein
LLGQLPLEKRLGRQATGLANKSNTQGFIEKHEKNGKPRIKRAVYANLGICGGVLNPACDVL